MKGIIIKCVSNDYTVMSENKNYICKPRGVFRNKNITPLVGDIVEFDENEKIIKNILPRKNDLIRPPVANIDNAIVVTSVKDPDLNTNLLDKMINIIEYNNIKPVLVFTKIDLLDDLSEIDEIITYYKKIGYKVFKNTEIDLIKKEFKDKVSILTGQSGAGKSTLLNKLDSKLNLKTNEISKALGRGKHTTRVVELYSLYGGLVADTPGFSALSFINMTNNDIRDNFIEFNDYKQLCKYSDCNHINEDDCEIKRLVESGEILESRYENYKKFISR